MKGPNSRDSMVVLARKPCPNEVCETALPGCNASPVVACSGRDGIVAALALERLGVHVELVGRCTVRRLRRSDRAAALGIGWDTAHLNGIGALPAVLPRSRTFPVIAGPNYAPTAEEGRYLVECPARAIAATGPLENGHVAFLAETAAGRNLPFFWNALCCADLSAANCGARVYLQVSAAEFGADGRAEALAAEVLVRSQAAAVIVTDSNRGAYGLLRGGPRVLRVPALPIAYPLRQGGAGEAHFAGAIIAFLDCPPTSRLERALAIGRLVAARHVAGLAPGDWTDLRRLEDNAADLPRVHVA